MTLMIFEIKIFSPSKINIFVENSEMNNNIWYLKSECLVKALLVLDCHKSVITKIPCSLRLTS